MTKLIIIRHSIPLNDGLSIEGRELMRKMAEKLKGRGIALNRIYTSPLLRAVQSAEIVADVFEAPIVEEEALGGDFREEKVLSLITPGETVAVVGHMPTLALFAEKLVGARILPEGICKGGIAILSFPGKIGWGEAVFEGYLQNL